jgi:hypothetical protein
LIDDELPGQHHSLPLDNGRSGWTNAAQSCRLRCYMGVSTQRQTCPRCNGQERCPANSPTVTHTAVRRILGLVIARKRAALVVLIYAIVCRVGPVQARVRTRYPAASWWMYEPRPTGRGPATGIRRESTSQPGAPVVSRQVTGAPVQPFRLWMEQRYERYERLRISGLLLSQERWKSQPLGLLQLRERRRWARELRRVTFTDSMY